MVSRSIAPGQRLLAVELSTRLPHRSCTRSVDVMKPCPGARKHHTTHRCLNFPARGLDTHDDQEVRVIPTSARVLIPGGRFCPNPVNS